MWIFWTILFLIASVVLSIYAWNEEGWHGLAGQWSVTCFLMTTMLLVNNLIEPEPKALDVYQGKTTLEYKVVDGEIVDSCVVWKNK